ncbi:MAG: NAD-dependent epimerase [Chitinophagales bacterium]|nr:MAG: NAD-dependent epimerase [Chitinophagales bacterium]
MVLITGATGFIGSYLTRHLVNQGYPVRALRRKNSDLSLLAEARDKVEWVEADVLDIPALEDAFRGVKKVFHLASLISFDPADRDRMMKINVEGTANVVNLCLVFGIEKLVFAGSYSSLGTPENHDPIHEDTGWNKNPHDSFYSFSKLQAEREVWRGIAEGLQAVIVNPTLVLGAGKWSDSSTRLFGAMTSWQPFYPIGSTGFVDVRDVARIMHLLMESQVSGEKFILNAENLSFAEVIREIAHQLGKKPPLWPLNHFWIPLARSVDWLRASLTGTKPLFNAEVAGITTAHLKYDNRKIRTLLHYEFIPVKQSIAETVAQLRKSLETRTPYAVLDI